MSGLLQLDGWGQRKPIASSQAAANVPRKPVASKSGRRSEKMPVVPAVPDAEIIGF